MSEMNLTVEEGSIRLRSEKPPTMQDVSDLAKAGELIGIPVNARITTLYFRLGLGPNGTRCLVDIGWSIE